MFSRVCKLFLIFLILAGGVEATRPDLSAWRFAREIKCVGSGKYQTFYLTEEVYKHTGPDIADLRITDKNGEFVPYYLQYGYTSYKTTGLPYRIQSDEKISKVILENKNRLKISALHFKTEGNFQRRFEVLGKEKESTRLTGEIYNLQFKDFRISQTSIDLADDPVTLEEIRIRIINYDNPPLKISEITAAYIIDKIVFEDTGGGPYRLYYGNPQAAKPHYDLEFYKMHLLKEKQDLSTLGEEQEFSETKAERPAWRFDYLFGLVIILVSLALIVLLVTKLNRNTN